VSAVSPVAEVSAVSLARFGGCDPGCLDALSLPATLDAIEAADTAADAMEAARPGVEAGLHRLVGGLDDKRLRRAALNTRRDAHNGRPCRTSQDVLAELGDLLDPAGARALAAWCEAGSAERVALERADARLEDEIESASEALRRDLADPELRCAIAMASPDFHDQLARVAAGVAPRGKAARTALSYLSRAAVKTSPFSTLTTVGWARVGTAGEPGCEQALEPGAQRRHRIGAAVPLAVELLVAFARDEELSEAFDFEVNATIRTALDGGRLLVGTRLAVNGFAWRREEIVELVSLGALAAPLLRVGRGRPASFRAALGGDDAHVAFARMLDLDVIRPVLPWSSEQEPLAGLAAAIAALPGDRPRQLARRLSQLAGELAALAAAPAAQRVRGQREALRTARGWLTDVGRPVGHWLAEAGTAYEDVFEEGCVQLGEHVRDDLALVAEDLWPRVVRSRLYDELVAAFVELHGPGGRCADVLEFLVGFLAAGSGRERVERAIHADMNAVAGQSDPGATSPSSAAITSPPSAMVRFQIAAASHGDVLAGRYRLVVNQCSQGPGGLLVRFAAPGGGAATTAAGAALRAWTTSLAPDADVVHVGFANDWSGLQDVPSQVAAELAWPGNLRAAPGRSPGQRQLSELELHHEPSTGGLALRGRDGRRVVPIYLGTVPAYLVGGPARLLMALGDPWILRVQPATGDDGRAAPGAVVAAGRREAGRVVLARRRWRVDPDRLPVGQPGESDTEFLRRTGRWRRGHGIPMEVFATARRSQLSFDARLRKPRWLRFDSLHALRAAEDLLGPGVNAVELTEALPARDEHWVRAVDGQPRAAEFVALVRWPKRCAASPA